jgi:hypothetical protein
MCIYPLGPEFPVTVGVASCALGLTPVSGLAALNENRLEGLERPRPGSAANVNTEMRVIMREGIFTKNVKAKMKRVKSSKGAR